MRGPGLSGTVVAFVRPGPQPQPGMRTVASHVSAAEFAPQAALIVGGSRGLGEMTAKIVAAGGGHALITFKTGAADARRVADEIRSSGGRCDAFQLDVADPLPGITAIARVALPTHVYYFASPRISAPRAGAFDVRLFERFAGYYVAGAAATYLALRSACAGPLLIF